MLRLGVQVSISGRLSKAVERAKVLGCNTIQIFSRNPRSFKRVLRAEEEIEEFKKKRREARIYPLFIHTVYTLNLASSDTRFYRLSIRDFIRDLRDAQDLGAEFIVTHIGSFKRSSRQKGIKRVIRALENILGKMPSSLTLLLENTSGSGHWLGADFKEIAYIINSLGKPKKIGVCLDTCHAFSAGYNLREAKGLRELLREIDCYIGLDRLRLIHLNDSQDKLGSYKDRHFHIGEGYIGEEGFRRIINHTQLKNLPFILETPKKKEEDDFRNLEKVRRLYKNL